MKSSKLFLALITLMHLTMTSTLGQVTITTGADWSDAQLLKSLKPSESYMATTNYGTYLR